MKKIVKKIIFAVIFMTKITAIYTCLPVECSCKALNTRQLNNQSLVAKQSKSKKEKTKRLMSEEKLKKIVDPQSTERTKSIKLSQNIQNYYALLEQLLQKIAEHGKTSVVKEAITVYDQLKENIKHAKVIITRNAKIEEIETYLNSHRDDFENFKKLLIDSDNFNQLRKNMISLQEQLLLVKNENMDAKKTDKLYDLLGKNIN